LIKGVLADIDSRRYEWQVPSSGGNSNGVFVVEGLLVASMLSMAIRTRYGSGSSTGTLPESLLIVMIVGLPSLLMVARTRRWRIWVFECLLSAPWLLIGLKGDYSGTDEGFVILLPLSLAVVQLALFALALVVPGLRRSLPPEAPSPDRLRR
jgi:hypothetical protein